MTRLIVEIDHPEAEQLLRAAIEGYARMAEHMADYTTASRPRESETTVGRARRAKVYADRATACRGATITPGGQAG